MTGRQKRSMTNKQALMQFRDGHGIESGWANEGDETRQRQDLRQAWKAAVTFRQPKLRNTKWATDLGTRVSKSARSCMMLGSQLKPVWRRLPVLPVASLGRPTPIYISAPAQPHVEGCPSVKDSARLQCVPAWRVGEPGRRKPGVGTWVVMTRSMKLDQGE